MTGRDSHGAFVTTSQSRYPFGLCRALAAAYLHDVKDDAGFGMEEDQAQAVVLE